MKICIIEPHSDDCFLNMGGSMLCKSKNEYRIITIAVSPKNYNKTFLLKRFCNVENICYSFKNIERYDFKEGENKNIESVFQEKNGISLRMLSEIIKKDTEGFDKVFLPMGYRDALHNVVSRLDIKVDGFYREYPYFWCKGEWKNTSGYSYRNFKTNNIINLPPEIVEAKWKIFNTIYKDQLGMLTAWRPFYTTIKDEQIFYA